MSQLISHPRNSEIIQKRASKLPPVAHAYPVSENEEDRLAEILNHDFLDGGPQESLDQICLLAKSLFNVPVALMTLVDREQQTFLAHCGVDALDVDRKDTFCTYTILTDEILVVPDASIDPRFAKNPLVTGELHVRFYAGAPLTIRPGIRIGSLCLLDVRPRTFSDAEASLLRMLATVAINELSRRCAVIDLKRQIDLNSQTARMANVGSWVIYPQTRKILWSEQMYDIFETEAGTALTLEALRGFQCEEGADQIEGAITAVARDGLPIDSELRIVTGRGNHRWVRCIAETDLANGNVTRITGSVQDITEEHSHAAEIERLAFHDSLTGLPNRALFQERLTVALHDAKRRGTKVGLVMLNLDHFKDVNEALGHDAGDALLRSISQHLASVHRKSDTVARIGGDEFAVILADVNRTDDLTRPLQELTELLRQPFQYQGNNVWITASIGIAVYPDDDQHESQLRRNAVIALNRAKAAGRNRLVTFEPRMREDLEARMTLLQEIRTGVEAKEFVLYYQPLVDIASREITGFEALMRWRHPTRGVLTPEKFLIGFEDQELSLQLGNLGLDAAIAQMRSWMDQDLKFGRVAVNLSASQFRSGDLAESVAKRLRDYRVPAACLTLEVTESVYMGWGADVVGDTVRALHASGILIALDDFGTGYASLKHLRQFPIDRLKIDKSFVQNGLDKPIVQAVLTMGTSMGMKIIAEGVETVEQLATLGAMGCHQAQGYLFAKPMEASEVGAFLRLFTANSGA